MDVLGSARVSAETLFVHPLFSSLARPAVDHILRSAEILELQAGQRLSAVVGNVARVGERYCFVLAGELAIVLDEARPAERIAHSEGKERPEYWGRFSAGELFSDGYLQLDVKAPGPRVDCMASGGAMLLATDAMTLAAVMRQYPDWRGRLAGAMENQRRRFLLHQEPTRRLVQDFFLRHGYGSARRLRVSEANRCLDCNKCEAACAQRHGHARMARSHATLGRLAFQRFCVDCTDKPCLQACASGAMLTSATGEATIGENCNGCGACARKCPYGAIRIVEMPYQSADFVHPLPVCGSDGVTSIPGLYVAGDAAGRRSTKQSIAEARRAADAMQPCSARLRPEERGHVPDAIIVGAGVAGMAAAERCHERGLRFIVLEKAPKLPAKATRLASKLPIGAGMEVLRVASTERGLLRVDIARESLLTGNVLLCTGSPTTVASSLCKQAGAAMIDPGTPAMATYASTRGTHPVGIKCDNCTGYSDRACIRACPTRSLIELESQDLFFEADDRHDGGRLFSGMAFVEGLSEQRARQHPKRFLSAALAIGVVLALVVIGLECFLRRALPGESALGLWRARWGSANPVWYSSGKGFGHWLGYIGTAFMLATLLYPLRTRCGVLKTLGAQSTWLTAHLWVGIIGSSLVTYHAAFKLDRWVALACYAMWTVVLSGAVGRYLYGIIHSGVGLAELEQGALSRCLARYAGEGRLGKHASKLLSPGPDQPGRFPTELFAMLWHELRDFTILTWLRFAGLTAVGGASHRRQVLRYLADIAYHRRARRNLESARRLIRYWRWVHILLTIAMFVLAGFHIAYGFMYKAV